MGRTVAVTLLWLVLGGWIGAMLFFSAVMAPSAFAVLDTPAQAGRLVSRTLAILNLAGAGLGVALALLARALGRGPGLWATPLLLAGLCLVSHFGVSAAIAELRLEPGPDADPALRARFGTLHRVSVALFGITLIGAAGLLVAHVRALVPHSPQSDPGPDPGRDPGAAPRESPENS